MAGRVALLDVNVLVALFDPDHVHHDLAHDWFADQRPRGWATCALTEAGFVRVTTNPRYRQDALRISEAVAGLRTFCQSGRHVFWPDSASLRDSKLFVWTAARGHRQVTDVCLLALAVRNEGALATFDRTIPLGAVAGADRRHLSVIEPE